MKVRITEKCVLEFPPDSDERLLLDASDRGYLSHVVVRTPEGMFPVFFIEPVRLQQDLEESIRAGQHYFAEVGLIVVPDLAIETLTKSVEALLGRGFFRFLRTIDETPNPLEI